MPARRPSLPGLARATYRRLPRPVQRAAFRSLAPVLHVSGSDRGLASLVVVCEAVDVPRLRATLEAIGQDAHAYREVLVVPVGSEAADGAREVLLDPPDPRVTLLPPQPTWQDAANAGAGAARGRYLQFLRACDPRLPDALAALVTSLAASGSQLATGPVVQRGRPAVWLERSTAAAHARPGRGLAPEQRPELAGDLGLGNKLFRTDTWHGSGCRLGPLDGWLLAPTLAAYLARAVRVDVLDRPVHEHLGGHGVRPFGAMPSQLPDLPLWTARAEQVERTLAGTALQHGWHRHVLDAALPGFLLDAERATPDEWALLRQLVARYAEAGAATSLPAVRAEARCLAWLTAADRRADVEALAVAAQELDGDVPTELTDAGDLLAAWSGLPPDLPEDARRLAPEESPLVTAVRRLRGSGETRTVDLFVRVDHLDLPAHPHRVEARLPDGTPVAVTTGEDAAATRWAASRFHRALLARLEVPATAGRLALTVAAGRLVRSGEVELAEPLRRHPRPDPGVVVTDLALDGADLVVTMTGAGSLRLLDDGGQELGTATAAEPRIPLRHEHYGRRRVLPTGFYRLLAPSGPPTVADDLLARFPLDRLGGRHRLEATLGPAGGLLLHLGPPLADDEQGRHAQQRLVGAYTADRSPVDHSVAYFESYVGRSATDNPRAIHDELRARRPGLTTYWGVSDHAQEVPAGAVPVLLRSREWYSLLARAGCLVVNTDVEAWFRRRPGQVLLQTFHGYPSKGMGLMQWRAGELPESRIAALRARGVDSWSAILTPSPEMTRHYREQYAYTGPALEHGYPRDDDLVGPEAVVRRKATRALLGIRDDQVAVLYAPTWRENLATRPRKADLTDFLDVPAAAEALGGDHVLLFRGHRFHRLRDLPAGVVDVTDHPEVNDLILASDAAVLDYSSMRFDYALTGNPMVFLVPDLEDYSAGTRSFLFPFEESAPGPFVRDTAGVVARLRDLEGLRSGYAGDIAAFNATYNRWHDGHAAERVVDELLALVELARAGSGHDDGAGTLAP